MFEKAEGDGARVLGVVSGGEEEHGEGNGGKEGGMR